MTLTAQDLDRLATVAATVAAEAEQADQARSELAAAQASLLSRVIDLARPALRAIGTRPKTSVSVAHHADVNYGGGVDTIERYPSRCLCLNSERPGPDEDNPRANGGAYEGADLFLREDGTLLELRYSGDWSRWQGSSWGWTAEVKEYTNPLEAIGDGWGDVDAYVATIAAALDKTVGSRETATAKNRQRAEQLGAIVSLLAKGGRS